MSEGVAGRTIAVTGGTGALGTALVRTLIDLGAREVRVLVRSDRFTQVGSRHVRGDLASRSALDELMDGADGVFHLAALKDIDACERDPQRAIDVNVVGSLELLRAATASRSLLWAVGASSVKACAPATVYGLTKALMERAFFSANAARTSYIAVRLPALWATRGSLLDRWLQDASAGKQISVTDPAMTRVAASVHDASLTLISSAAIEGGGVLVPRSRAYRVGDLAQVVAESYRIDIHVAGRRPGEKTHDDLVAESERAFARPLADGTLITPGVRQSGVPAMTSAEAPRYSAVDLQGLVHAEGPRV